MAHKPEVLEIDDHMGVFTIGINDRFEAHEAILDWYYTEMSTKQGRRYFTEYYGVDLSDLDPTTLKEAEMMRCHGENCNGRWWVDDTECYECERDLDRRTRTKTFYLYW